jgi:cytidylate kinase
MLHIAISGKQGAGKSTVKNALKVKLKAKGFPTEDLSFATPLKAALGEILTSLAYDIHGDPNWKVRFRKQLQMLGTSLRNFNEDVWADMLEKSFWKHNPNDIRTIFLNDDLRYENEAHRLKDLGFFLVRIEASPELRAKRIGGIVGGEHASENDLDDFAGWDFIYVDSGDAGGDKLADLIIQQIEALRPVKFA